MSRRWAVVLPLLHVAMSITWIWEHNEIYWLQIPAMEKLDDLSRTHPPISSATTQEEVDFETAAEAEYRPSLEAKAIIGTNPVPTLLAGFEFPYSTTAQSKLPLLRPLIMPLASHLRLKTRIFLLNGILVILIWLQWTLVGRLLDRVSPPTRFITRTKSPALQITALAALAGIFNAIYRATESSLAFHTLPFDSELLGSLCSVAALLIWLAWGVIVIARFILGFCRPAQN